MDIQALWKYYTLAAALQGRKRPSEKTPVPSALVQANYSLLWFFAEQQDPGGLNELTRAFLGSPNTALSWEEPLPADQLDSFWLEGLQPNDSQRRAIYTAFRNSISFIQGPPGTGKTATILNLLSCILHMGKKAAVVSSNNSALNNIQDKISGWKDPAPNQRLLQEAFVRLGGKSYRDGSPKEDPPVSFNQTHPDLPSSERFQCARLDISREGLEWLHFLDEERAGEWSLTVSREGRLTAQSFLNRYPIISSTVHSLKNCFQDGGTYLYDYVIMDESSQTNLVAGLTAMSCARHLVLVGDQEQLPPVVNAGSAGELELFRQTLNLDVPEQYRVRENRSFLDLCREVFPDPALDVFLEEHYRCHPAIIGFCAQEIYGGRLQVRTPDDGRIPIKVLWFEGDYCESAPVEGEKEGEKERGYSKQNLRQAAIFLEEEWPRLRQRMERENLTACILTPFRGQRAILRKALQEDAPNLEIKQLEAQGDENVIPMLSITPPVQTIHKAQGQEFDIVYLLPVEDADWEWPWSQHRRLINVAVSRAKRELRLILSTALMDGDVQRELTGYAVAPRSNPRLTGQERAQGKEQERYLKKLVAYARDRHAAAGSYPASSHDFGFHRARRRSIFDREPLVRQLLGKQADLWAPQLCVEDALVQAICTLWNGEEAISLHVLTECLLQDLRDGAGQPPDLSDASEEMRSLVENGGHFDFLVCYEGQVLLAVEADGAYHRMRDGGRDAVKNDFVREVLHGVCYGEGGDLDGGSFTFLRLPDNGRTVQETELFLDLLRRRIRTLSREPDRPLPEGAWFLRGKSLSAIFQERMFFPELARQTAVRQAGQLLTAQGWITERNYHKELFPSFAQKAEQREDYAAKAPTEKGFRSGMFLCYNISKKGTPYAVIGYTEKGEAMLARFLENGGKPPAAFQGNPPSKGSPAEAAPGEQAVVTRNTAVRDLRGALRADMPICDLVSAIFLQLQSRFGPGDGVRQGLLGVAASMNFLRTVDYDTEDSQAYYLLRFLYGYAYEYKCMYRDLLAAWRPGGPVLSAVSIGCGNLVDYWGLRAALNQEGLRELPVDYTGIDLADWSERLRIQASAGDQARFVCQSAVDYLQNPENEAAELYIIPKSISDFDGQEAEDGPVLDGIRKGLTNTLRRNGRETVHLLISLRRKGEREIYPNDWAKCLSLVRAVQAAGYETPRPPTEEGFFSQAEERMYIHLKDDSFCFPMHIHRLFTELNKDYPEEVRMPMLSTGHLCYQILSFRRKEGEAL